MLGLRESAKPCRLGTTRMGKGASPTGVLKAKANRSSRRSEGHRLLHTRRCQPRQAISTREIGKRRGFCIMLPSDRARLERDTYGSKRLLNRDKEHLAELQHRRPERLTEPVPKRTKPRTLTKNNWIRGWERERRP